MAERRDDDSRLLEVEAALAQLRQVKEDTFNLIAKLQRVVPRSRGARGGKSWMAPQATEGGVINPNE